MATLVLTAIGDDHAGLVSELSGVIADHGGNWEKSRMAHLAGKFAGIVMVTVAEDDAEDLIRDLRPLEARGLLDITAALSTEAQPAGAAMRLTLELVGLDQPGIVRDISDALAARGVSIEELETEISSAPMDGGTLFKARAVLALPDDVSAEALADVLEQLAHQLMVDIELHQAGDPT
jgi:glycine cleavage system regulatory protein